MSDLIKKQHFVWRAYLRAWADKEMIWAYLKTENKVIKSNLMGVGQQRYFYELENFTVNEETFLRKFIERNSHSSLNGLNSDFLFLFTAHYRLRELLISSRLSTDEKLVIEKQINGIEKNQMELAHGKIENLGILLIESVKSADFSFLDDDDNFLGMMMFLCFQYFRTKKMKASILNSADKFRGMDVRKLWNVISFTMSTGLARNLSLDPSLRMTFYKNNTETDFLTCDQPIFNIVGNEIDEEGYSKSLELYYPLSPKISLLIHFRTEQIQKYTVVEIGLPLVKHFNDKVVEVAENMVFSDKKENLDCFAIANME